MNNQPQDMVVLLVEDDPSNILVAQKLLQFMGIQQCITLDSGPAALEFIRRQAAAPQRIDLALLDVRMPDVDGFTLQKEIRAIPAWAAMRVVAVSASIMPEEVREVKQAGFDGLIGKPLDMDRFPDQIKRIMSGESLWEPQ